MILVSGATEFVSEYFCKKFLSKESVAVILYKVH